MFKWPNVFDIWNTYLSKFIKRYVSTVIVIPRRRKTHCSERVLFASLTGSCFFCDSFHRATNACPFLTAQKTSQNPVEFDKVHGGDAAVLAAINGNCVQAIPQELCYLVAFLA